MKVIASLFLLFTVLGVPTAALAHEGRCVAYLTSIGVGHGDAHKECRAQRGRTFGFMRCVQRNVASGVRPDKAVHACR